MSVLVPDNLRDYDCKKGQQVTQQPPISYMQFMNKPWISETKKIKLNLGEGNTFTCNLMKDSSNAEFYLKWNLIFLCVKEKKKLDKKLAATFKLLKKVLEDVKKFLKIPKKESI